jgi:hypothetical protein
MRAGACGLAFFAFGCGDEDEQERSLDPRVLGMNSDVAPSYQDQEITLYEVKLPVMLPIREPSRNDMQQLEGRQAPPFPHYPFVLADQVKVQVTWTLSNLDPDEHAVEILIDPWNEFGRYWPGFEEVDTSCSRIFRASRKRSWCTEPTANGPLANRARSRSRTCTSWQSTLRPR